jgi:peptide deformylase
MMRRQETVMQFDRTKLRTVVLYTCARCDPTKLGAVKLHKVLYFTDMLHYAQFRTPITGATYRKRPYGPTCDELLPLLRDLAAEGAIAISEAEYFGYRKTEYVAKEAPQTDLLSRRQLSLLDDVIEFVCYDNTAKSISEFSHNAAWESAEPGEILPYSSAMLMFSRDVPLEAAPRESSKSRAARAVIEARIPHRDSRTRDIIKLPDKRLWLASEPVDRIDQEIQQLADDMLATMYQAPGIGLAAIQIGVRRRIFTMDLSKNGDPPEPLVLINPEILWRSEERASYEEGCLSIPDYYEEVERPAKVEVTFFNRDGAKCELTAEGLRATCLQHEIDHLNGVLFIDHISKLKRSRVIKKFAKSAKRADH